MVAMKRNGLALKYVEPPLNRDKQVIEAAVA